MIYYLLIEIAKIEDRAINNPYYIYLLQSFRYNCIPLLGYELSNIESSFELYFDPIRNLIYSILYLEWISCKNKGIWLGLISNVITTNLLSYLNISENYCDEINMIVKITIFNIINLVQY
jgi:hypothetical protein